MTIKLLGRIPGKPVSYAWHLYSYLGLCSTSCRLAWSELHELRMQRPQLVSNLGTQISFFFIRGIVKASNIPINRNLCVKKDNGKKVGESQLVSACLLRFLNFL